MEYGILRASHRLQCYLNPFFIAHWCGEKWYLPSAHGDEQHLQYKPGCVKEKASSHILHVINVRIDALQETD